VALPLTYSGTSISCIYDSNHINALPLLEFCSRDVATVRILYSSGGNHTELILTSANLDYDADDSPPTKDFRELVDYCSIQRK
jgi:hypothetical protein